MKCSNCEKQMEKDDDVYLTRELNYHCCSAACLLNLVAIYRIMTVKEYEKFFSGCNVQ